MSCFSSGHPEGQQRLGSCLHENTSGASSQIIGVMSVLTMVETLNKLRPCEGSHHDRLALTTPLNAIISVCLVGESQVDKPDG